MSSEQPVDILLTAIFNDDFTVKNDGFITYSLRGKYTSHYMKATEFNGIITDYIRNKLKSNNLLTDAANNVNVTNAYNALYIDLDYHFRKIPEMQATEANEEDLDDFLAEMDKQKQIINVKLAKLFILAARASYAKTSHHFTFLCENFNNDKGGVHILFFTNELLMKNARNELVIRMKQTVNDMLKTNVEDLNLYRNNIENFSIDNIFDTGAFMRPCILLPFAQKDPNGRHYKYYKKLSCYSDNCLFINTAIDAGDAENAASKTTFAITDAGDAGDAIAMEMLQDNQQNRSSGKQSLQATEANAANAAFMQESNETSIDFIQPEYLLTQKSKLIYDFVGSFRYLSCKHRIWSILTNTVGNGHNDYYYGFVKPYFMILLIYNLWGSDNEEEFTTYRSTRKHAKNIFLDILTLIAKQLANLCLETLPSNSSGISANSSGISANSATLNGRYSYTEQLANMKQMFGDSIENFFTNTITAYDVDNLKDSIAAMDAENVDNNDEDLPVILSLVTKRFVENTATILKTYFFMKHYNFSVKHTELKTKYLNNKEFLNNSVELDIDFRNVLEKSMKLIMNFYDKAFEKFTENVIDVFTDNLTNEIEPFNRLRSYTNQICYRDDFTLFAAENVAATTEISANSSTVNSVSSSNEITQRHFRERLTFYDVEPDFVKDERNRNRSISDTTYNDTMKLWIKTVLIFKFYNTRAQLQAAVKDTLSGFVREYFTVDDKRNGDKTKRILIYNVRQTIGLESYPYNQWIADIDRSNLENWLNKLYRNYIEPNLKDKGRDMQLYGFVRDRIDNDIGFEANSKAAAIANTKEFKNTGRDLTTMLDNIVMIHATETSNVPIKIPVTTCDIFPMRNGWLHFITSRNATTGKMPGDIEFSRDNKGEYIESGTNIIYVGDENEYFDYCKHCKEAASAYNTVTRMIQETYPIADELEFNMLTFSSLLIGSIKKTTLHIMYGTGKDGKSTMIDGLMSMLDSEGFVENVNYYENGRKIQLKTTGGLGATIKSEALMIASKSSSNHDEGGKAMFIGKRLVSAQEPQASNNDGKLCGSIIKELTGGGVINARRIFQGSTSSPSNALITLQTNDLLGTDDCTDGFMRRLRVYKHRSKFITNDVDAANYEFQYVANSDLQNIIKTSPYFKQAFFYYLLPYARTLLRKGYDETQKIPIIPVVEEARQNVKVNSTGINGWLCSNIVAYNNDNDNGKKVFTIINIRSLVRYLIEVNKRESYSIWKDTNKGTIEEKSVGKQIQDYYEGRVFRLKDDFYEIARISKGKRLSNKTDINYKDNDLKTFIANIANITNQTETTYDTYVGSVSNMENFRNTYLRKSCVNSFEDSKTSKLYEDLFLVGYYYIDNDVVKMSASNSMDVETIDDLAY